MKRYTLANWPGESGSMEEDAEGEYILYSDLTAANWNATETYGVIDCKTPEDAKRLAALFNRLRNERDEKDAQLTSCYARMEKAEKRLAQLHIEPWHPISDEPQVSDWCWIEEWWKDFSPRICKFTVGDKLSPGIEQWRYWHPPPPVGSSTNTAKGAPIFNSAK